MADAAGAMAAGIPEGEGEEAEVSTIAAGDEAANAKRG